MNSIERARRHLLQIYQAGIDRVDGERAVVRSLEPVDTPVSVIAIGKAAQAMIRGAAAVLGEQLEGGIAISKPGHLDFDWLREHGLEAVEGGHPLPDAGSLEAGRRLLEFLGALPPGRPLLFLISGGASSLVEVPVDGVDLEFLQRANHWLLGSGLSIVAMNRMRRSLSRIKGGGLLAFLGGRPARCLLISDVPGDDPAVIGSGLLVAPPADGPEPVPGRLPEWLGERISRLPKSRPAEASPVEIEVVACLRDAREAAARKAGELGYPVGLSHAHLSAEAENTGRRLALELIDSMPGVYVWGGEPSVRLPEQPGRGGRCQHLALGAATVIEGRSDVCLLAAGTDGGDGPGEDAGAMVDGGTLGRGKREGLDARECLRRADSGSFLEASGDLVHTGPTGTNVMDLVIGVKI